MKQIFPIAIALMLVGGEMKAETKSYAEYVAVKCSGFTQHYAASGFKWNKGFPSYKDRNFAGVMFYLLGYLTYAGKNIVAESHHVNNPNRQAVNPIAWIGSWCRDHPSDSVSDAADAYIAK
jgi:hypothetical protein